MKRTSQKPKKAARAVNAKDFELSLVATIAALLKIGDHELNFNRAALNALELLDECQKKLDEHRQMSMPENVPYKEAVGQITGRSVKRFNRIEEAFKKFIEAGSIREVRDAAGHVTLQYDIQRPTSGEPSAVVRPPRESLEEDIRRFFDRRKRVGFPKEEIGFLQGAYGQWKTERQPQRKKK
jgi:hypothetical protein